ncbi:MAG: DUF1616 domain-containing protein [Thermoplasmata archaeon]
MSAVVGALEFTAGILLLFFLPGAAVTLALFPEWRLTGPGGRLRTVETVALSFVLSVALTILGGYALVVASPVGFSADWSDPLLEGLLVAITVAALMAALARGRFAVPPPVRRAPDAPGETGEDGAWELGRRLDRIAREERRLAHALRSTPAGPAREAVERSLRDLAQERERLREAREAEYAR